MQRYAGRRRSRGRCRGPAARRADHPARRPPLV